jgi:pimeloyl-ACP methyl ester carboxylesterase
LPVGHNQLSAYIADFPKKPRQPGGVIGYQLERTPITVTAVVEGKAVASQAVGRILAQGTAGQDVTGPEGWRGLYFPPAAGQPKGEPIVIMTGSGGGVFDDTAALLASHGHPALALALYNYPGLPNTLHDFPIERVRDAGRWLAAQAGTSRVAVAGVSRGSEAAQLAAIHFPEAFSSVIALVPSHLAGSALGPGTTIAQGAWSIGGKPLNPFSAHPFPSARAAEMGKTAPGYVGAEQYLELWSDPAVEAASGLPYERLRVPILLIAAGADDVWPSAVSVERIRRRLTAAGKANLVEAHSYPGAGHTMVFPGRGSDLSNFGYIPALGGFMSSGGLPNLNCEASFDHINRILAFLRRVH